MVIEQVKMGTPQLRVSSAIPTQEVTITDPHSSCRNDLGGGLRESIVVTPAKKSLFLQIGPGIITEPPIIYSGGISRQERSAGVEGSNRQHISRFTGHRKTSIVIGGNSMQGEDKNLVFSPLQLQMKQYQQNHEQKGLSFLKVVKKDIIEVKQHYEAVTNLTKKRISLMNEEKHYMRGTQSTVHEEISGNEIVGWNGQQCEHPI